jgi:hypothetical protein
MKHARPTKWGDLSLEVIAKSVAKRQEMYLLGSEGKLPPKAAAATAIFGGKLPCNLC